jgi:hypothetical protein
MLYDPFIDFIGNEANSQDVPTCERYRKSGHPAEDESNTDVRMLEAQLDWTALELEVSEVER